MEQSSAQRRRWPERLLRFVARGLMASGGIMVCGLFPDAASGRGPSGRHPERLRPDLALTPLERALAVELFPQGWPREP
ncbi:DUF6059 family protein [Kitasatospora sp. KL5]|uniref:DUF6059 family protein n=1 Tax=Kitasatospora sp. KL5 TaxID=3425125 RepID=UPI003D6E5B15